MTNKKDLSERDICTKYISPALERVGWDMHKQVREEAGFTDGRIYVKGNLNRSGFFGGICGVQAGMPCRPRSYTESMGW